jgi:hypothetical protein
MKPFNLSEALEGKPVVTRDGRKVLKVVYFEKLSEDDQSVLAHIEGQHEIDCFNVDGTYYNKEEQVQEDLFMKEDTKQVWIGIAKTPIMLVQALGSTVYHATSACESKERLLKAMEGKLDKYDIRMIEI